MQSNLSYIEFLLDFIYLSDMSTTANNNTRVCSDSNMETGTTPTYAVGGNEQSLTWVDRFTQLDPVLSTNLLRLCYIFTDIVLLSLGLYYGITTCSISNSLAAIYIPILVFSGLEVAFVFILLVRNWSSRRRDLFDVENSCWMGNCVILFCRCSKFICICIGTAYVFTPEVPINNDCEIVRFYLGIVCFSTWMFSSPRKPSLPIRRSLILEFCVLLVVLMYYSIYFGLLAFPLMKTQAPECIYTRIEDLYFRAPLQSFAYAGLILIGSMVSTSILTAIFNQLFYRLSHYRRVFLHLSAIIFVISYIETLVYIYYFSVGAVLLFQPRSGEPCYAVAPNLYKILYILQIISFLAPFIILGLVLLLSCLGLMFGACLARCLPASIAVPLFEMLRVCFVVNTRNSIFIFLFSEEDQTLLLHLIQILPHHRVLLMLYQ